MIIKKNKLGGHAAHDAPKHTLAVEKTAREIFIISMIAAAVCTAIVLVL